MPKSVVDKRRFDIWRYQDFFSGVKVPERFWISDVRTDFTALEKRADTLWIKHEDEHPLGSHKGRSLAYQLSFQAALGKENLVLSSSGNAAIAFLQLTQSSHSVALVSAHTDPAKLAYMQTITTKGKLAVSNVAPSLVNALVKKYDYTDLRPSSSKEAITGLSSLGFELWEQLPELSNEYAIVGVTTSGGNMLGLAQAFSTLREQGYINSLPRLYPVLLQDYKSGYLSPERKRALEEAASVSGGRIITMAPVKNGTEPTSFEGNTAYQAYLDNQSTLGKTIVLFTGRIWPQAKPIDLPSYISLAALTKDFKI